MKFLFNAFDFDLQLLELNCFRTLQLSLYSFIFKLAVSSQEVVESLLSSLLEKQDCEGSQIVVSKNIRFVKKVDNCCASSYSDLQQTTNAAKKLFHTFVDLNWPMAFEIRLFPYKFGLNRVLCSGMPKLSRYLLSFCL